MTRLYISVLALGLCAAAVAPENAEAQVPVLGVQIGRGGYYNGYGRGYYGGYGRGYYRGYPPATFQNGPGFSGGYGVGNNGYSIYGAAPYGYGNGNYNNGYDNSGYYGQSYGSAYNPMGFGVYSNFTNGW